MKAQAILRLITVCSNPKMKRVEVNELYLHLNEKVKLYFEVHGSGEALLCLHGNRDSSAVYKNLAQALKKYFYLICPDLRGHGNSRYEGQPFAITDMVDDIILLLDQLAVERVSVLGHSLGSTLALLLALKQPDRVEKLVLIGAAASFEPPFKRPAVGQPITKEVIEEVHKAAEGYFFSEKHAEVKELILRGWASMPSEMHQMMVGIKHPDLHGILEKIKNPVLLICGQEDKVTPVAKAMELNQKLYDSRLLVIPDAGHFVFLEEEKKVFSAVISFLKERL